MVLGDLVCSKALDDRLGCVILLQLLQESFACDFYGVFTVQEELGTRGAMAATAQVAPSWPGCWRAPPPTTCRACGPTRW